MRSEFTSEQWAARPASLRRIRINHSCVDPAQCNVFRCRDRQGYSCGRYRCEAVGGCDDNRCDVCWTRFQRNAESLLLAHIARNPGQREDKICKHFGAYGTNRIVEDALFGLMQQGFLLWFGRSDRPLKYRITEGGRNELKRLNAKRKRGGK